MKIKRTIKPEWPDAGKTEVIGEDRMRNICLQVAGLTYHKGLQSHPQEEAEKRLAELRAGYPLETFYATYEPIQG